MKAILFVWPSLWAMGKSLQSVDSVIHQQKLMSVPSNYMFLKPSCALICPETKAKEEGGRRSGRWTEGPGEEAPVPAVEFRSGGLRG